MIEFEYLKKGLNAMARAHRTGSMTGHLGAAAVAGYFFGEQRPGLDREVVDGIESDLDKVIAGESVFGKRMYRNAELADRELFADFPEERPDEGLVDAIAEALGRTIGDVRQSGHNVIFGSLAIRALREHPEFATPSIVDGIVSLLRQFDGAHPGSGYYGKERGRIRGNRVAAEDVGEDPGYTDVEGMARAVFDEMIALEPDVHRQGYGGLVHVINHAAAIADLADYGHAGFVPRALASHRRHLQLWRGLPDLAAELGPVPVSATLPTAPRYWTSGEVPYDRALLTHRAKTLFGFAELAGAVDLGDREDRAYEKFRYLM